MRKIAGLICMIALVLGCNSKEKTEEKTTDTKAEMAYISIGKEIMADDALSAERMAEHYKGMMVGDTVNSKMVAKVDEVCQSKGCWMKLDLEDGNQIMVKFKDYGFFMPKDIAGKEVIINGIAFVDEMSVEDQRHYAEDAGKSEEEIQAIQAPKKTYSFEADGVLLKQ
ncbi:MAG: DUF4920 domain-containing protein [Bacteroidia bacterium]|nr:DUF4920 domain-containing protein [Bacteroidia bacterium]NND52412.1 DUF4920 domain-containing protein [Flavobacteriaceae bacterium]